MAYLPGQAPGPGPTAQPLPSYQSYSAYTTETIPYLSTLTRIVYDPAGTVAPSIQTQVISGTETSTRYSIVNLPLLYDGPLPPPPLGTLYTTSGQRLPSGVPNPTPSGSESGGSTPTVTQTGTVGGSGTGTATATATRTASGSGTGNGGASNAGGGGTGGGNGGQPTQTAAPAPQPQPTSGQQGGGNNGGNGNNGNGNGGNGASNGNGDGNGATTPGANPGPNPNPNPTATETGGATATSDAGFSPSESAASSASLASASSASAASSLSASLASNSATSTNNIGTSSTTDSMLLPSMTSSSTSPNPTSTDGGFGTSNVNRSGLSGGQIAGIVIGSLLAFILLLILLLCCARRRRARMNAADGDTGAAKAALAGTGPRRKISDRWASGFSEPRGRYAALGAAGAGAGVGAAAMGAGGASNGSMTGSDEWEPDHLSGGDGSGFFVVGGRRQGSHPSLGRASARSLGMGSPSGGAGTTTMANISSERNGKSGTGSGLALGAGMAGLRAGIAAALGRRKSSSNKGKPLPVPTRDLDDDEVEEEDRNRPGFSDEDDDAAGDLGNGERRGLMEFANVGRRGAGAAGTSVNPFGDDQDEADVSREMSQAGPSRWGYAGAAAGAAGVVAAGAAGAALYNSSIDKDPQPTSQDTDASHEYSSISHRPPGRAPSESGASSSGPGWQTAAAISSSDAERSTHGGVTLASSRHHRRDSSGGAQGGYASGTGSATGGYTSTVSAAGSGSGSGSGSGAGSGDRSSQSTGGRTYATNSSPGGTSLPPPPRAPRTMTVGNLSPSVASEDTFVPSSSSGGPSTVVQHKIPRLAPPSEDGDGYGTAAALGGGAAVAGLGLAALAAGHRESGASTYSQGMYPSGDSSRESYNPSANTDERHSRFISRNTPLLGPGAALGPDAEARLIDRPGHTPPLDEGDFGHKSRDPRSSAGAYLNPYTGAPGGARLPTIRSVGEFGEGNSSAGSPLPGGVGGGSGSGSNSGSGRGVPQGPESTRGGAHSLSSEEPLPLYQPMGNFYTPPASPRGTLGQARSLRSYGSGASRGGAPSRVGAHAAWSGEEGEEYEAEVEAEALANPTREGPFADDQPEVDAGELADDEDRHGGSKGGGVTAAAAAGGVGLLGGLAAGWRRLTMGAPPGTRQGNQVDDDDDDVVKQAADEARIDADDELPRLTHNARRDPAQQSDSNLAAEVQSLQASVHGADSALGHRASVRTSAGQSLLGVHSTSREGSSGSPSPNRAGSLAPSQHSSDLSGGGRAAGGYSASISNSSESRAHLGGPSIRSVRSGDTSGIDSLSQRTHLTSSGGGGVSSSSRSRSGTDTSSSRRGAGSSGASTGAASYSPSHLQRHSTASTRGGASSSSGLGRGTRATDGASSTYDLEGDYGSDGQSSRATAGGDSSLGGRSSSQKRRRSGSLDGATVGTGAPRTRALSDVLEGGSEAQGPIEDLYGHYPSESLGAAAMRQAYRDAAEARGVPATALSDSTGSVSGGDLSQTPRAIPRNLIPGVAPPLPPSLSTSISQPSLRDLPAGVGANAAALGHSSLSSSQSSSSAWRQSPRVASASLRASEAAAHLDAARAAGASSGNVGAAVGPSNSSPRRSRLRESTEAGQDIEATAEGQATARDEGAEGDNSTDSNPNRSFDWPKFLRF